VETGTYRGDSALLFASVFGQVHTIELSEKYHRLAGERLRGLSHVHCYEGDSGEVLPGLLRRLSEPLLVFLDAHWAGGDTAFGVEEVPLLRELRSLAQRRQQDIIVIDDVRLLGRQGETGSELDPDYPVSRFDWRLITWEAMEKTLSRGIRNPWFICSDRIFIFRNRQPWQGLLLLLVFGPTAVLYELFLRVRTALMSAVAPSGSGAD
jgi:predicted O-methyltransferase YrrM